VSHHRECDISIPTMPVADLIFVQARFASGFFDALLNRVAGRGHLRQLQEWCVGKRIGQVVGDVGWLAERTTGN